MQDPQRPSLHVCITCRAGRDLADDETPPGRTLYDAIEHRLAAFGTEAPVDLIPVKCLVVCERGCSAAISMPGKWSYLLGRLDPGMIDDVLAYARTYAASATGAVLPSRRPESLRNGMLGRFPSLVAPALESAA